MALLADLTFLAFHYKCIISAPSNIAYPDKEERKQKMKQHSDLLEGVQDVLGDKKKVEELCLYKQKQIDEIMKDRTLKWNLQELINDGTYAKLSKVAVPQNIQNEINNIVDDEGFSSIKDLTSKENSINNHEETLTALMKERLRQILQKVDPEKVDLTQPLLQQYEDALSVNNKFVRTKMRLK